MLELIYWWNFHHLIFVFHTDIVYLIHNKSYINIQAIEFFVNEVVLKVS